jgi:Ni,Fe-hydrogenase I small subunit
MLAGTNRSVYRWMLDLAPHAGYVIAVGSCAAYGGVPAAGSNPTDAVGLQFEGTDSGGALGAAFRSRLGLPVINVAGCAPHPGWMMETILALTTKDIAASDLDGYGRPKFVANHLAHHGCSRNEFYEFKASAEIMSERGCLMEHLGCKATQAVASGSAMALCASMAASWSRDMGRRAARHSRSRCLRPRRLALVSYTSRRRSFA